MIAQAIKDLERLGAVPLSDDEADVQWSIPEEEYANRRDLRDHRIFTIDPTSARDLDDAVHIRVSDLPFSMLPLSLVVTGSPLSRPAASRR